MRRGLIRKVLVIVAVVLVLIGLVKWYHFVVVRRMFDAINEFRNEENRAYFVKTVVDENMILEEKIMLKEGKIKHTNMKKGSEVDCKWENFEKNEEYFFNIEKKKVYINNLKIGNKDSLYSLPSFIEYLLRENKLKLNGIVYILPIKYNNEFCYKIVTKKENIIIRSSTYLPIYSSVKRVKLDKKTKIEKTYEFKVGEVTDEDVALPDLSKYTLDRLNR